MSAASSPLAVLSWDWREQPNLDELARAVREVSGGTVHVAQVDTSSDQYAIVVSTVALDGPAVVDAYDRWLGSGEETP
jgi:hypothetical protein